MSTHACDVVIVGAGLCGSAVGHYCANAGLAVTLLERGAAGGEGATKHSRGIVRVYDPNPRLMQWSRKAVEIWNDWDVAGPSPFTACGVLYLVARAHAADAERQACRFGDADYPIRVLRGAELTERFDFLALRDRDVSQQVALFEPRGGYCDPRLAARLFAESLRRAGGALLEGVEVQGVRELPDGVEIQTSAEPVFAKIALLALGAHTPDLLPQLDLFSRSIPLTCFEHGGGAPQCCVIDELTGAYLRPEPLRYFYCGGAHQSDGRRPQDLPAFEPRLHAQHRSSIAALFNVREPRAVAGLMGCDAYTSSGLPILGFQRGSARLFVAAGFCGRGAKFMPAVGRQISQEIADRLVALP